MREGQLATVVVIAVGGGLGAAGRYGAGLIWPTAAPSFPWTTLAINATGCALIGVLLVLIAEVWAAHRLVRPFLGTGVLGGFTTFSTYAVDVERLLDAGEEVTALVYLVITPVLALLLVWWAASMTRRLVARRAS
jgi:CrcB protein